MDMTNKTIKELKDSIIRDIEIIQEHNVIGTPEYDPEKQRECERLYKLHFAVVQYMREYGVL